MLVSILGVQRKFGTFTNKEGRAINFDNVMLHTARDNNLVDGACVEVLKVKTPLAEGSLGVSVAEGGNLGSLIGHNVNVAFDRYGNVEMLELV